MARVFLFIIIIVSISFVPKQTHADSLGQTENFFVDASFDTTERSELTASLRKLTGKFYFYMEDEWWNPLSFEGRNVALAALGNIAERFEEQTYPKLTRIFGTENIPGVDNDTRITVLVHRMDAGSRGYVRTGDGYTRLEVPESNEREMFYVSTTGIESPRADAFFAHEFLHLIYFNQKELKQGVQEDVWIQEGLAEVAPTIAGLADPFEESYLAKRIRDFVSNPRDSLTEWLNRPSDYGVASLFFHYLKDQYGEVLLRDIMWSSEKGIAAINDAFIKNKISKTFSQAFEDWTIAVFVNDCSLGEQYCYKDENLKNVRVLAFTSFLSPFGDTELRVTNQTKVWTGNWNKISGSKGLLRLNFEGYPVVSFKVPYLLQGASGEYELGFLSLNEQQEGSVEIEDFGEKYSAITILPAIHDIIRNIAQEPSFFLSWTAMTVRNGGDQNDSTEITRLLTLIKDLKRQVAVLQAQLASIKGNAPCKTFEQNLFFGMPKSGAVSCLQQLLKDQGPTIYPEGLVTGNFLSLTQGAVIRFQEKYAAEILHPLGLQRGTGYVGPSTRSKLNSLLAL